MMTGTIRDLKYSLRMLRRNPGFAAVVVITLALGIGANTAMFSFVHAVILDPLPFPDSSRLVVMTETNRGGEPMSVSLLNFQDWRARSRSFEAIAGYRTVSFNLSGAGSQPQRLSGRAVTPNFFQVLGVQPQLGRLFTEQDDQYGAPPTALISDSLWKSTFGADPNIVGRSLNLGITQFTVIGVLPPDLEFIRQNDVWAPFGGWLRPGSSWYDRGDHRGLIALGRLKAGVPLEQAQAEMKQIAGQLEREYPATNTGNSAFTRTLQSAVVQEVSSMLLVLMGAVGFVLLIACVNVANLSLARAATRMKEIGIRVAMGASRGRVMRQLFTENLLLALLGGLVGVLTARWLLQGLLALAPTDLPRVAHVQIDAEVLIFTAALTLLTSLLFGLLPTWQATRGSRFVMFNLGARSSTSSPARRRLFDSLMVAEVGLALILLTGAGLMTRTIYKLSQVDPGFRRDHLLTMRFDLSGPKYDDNAIKQEAFLRDAAARLKVLPGVAGAGFTGSLPIQGSEWGSVFIVGDQPVPERSKIPVAAFNLASPGYLETMQIGLRRGRLFTEADGPDAPTVAVINETMARRFWQDEDPIGKRLKQGWPESDTPWREVVGVVADVKLNGITEETPLHVYLPIAQEGGDSLSMVLRTQLDPLSIAASAQAAIHEVDPDLPLYQVRTMDEIFSRATLRQRGAMILLTAFAILAVLLAAVGIYGVISWGVAQRAREMGVRMALGAQQFDVLWLVLRRNMLLAFGGVGLGLGGAFALTRVLSSLLSETGTGKTPLLFGVNVVDPLTFIAVPLLLSFVALLACVLPARRATRVDPMVVLRYE